MPPSEGRDAISAYSSTGIIPRSSNFRNPVTVPTDWIVESGVVFHGDVTFSPGVRADDNVTCMETATVEDWVTFGDKARFRGITYVGNDVKFGQGAQFSEGLHAGHCLRLGNATGVQGPMTAGDEVQIGSDFGIRGSVTAKDHFTAGIGATIVGDLTLGEHATFGDHASLGSSLNDEGSCVSLGAHAKIGYIGKKKGVHNSLIRGKVWIGDDSHLGQRVFIDTGADYESNIGAGSIIGDHFKTIGPGKITIGSNCSIGRYARLCGGAVTIKQGTRAKSINKSNSTVVVEDPWSFYSARNPVMKLSGSSTAFSERPSRHTGTIVDDQTGRDEVANRESNRASSD